MSIRKIIAIDGPAASGKSTLGIKLAQCLGYLYFDTGVMYRAVTWIALMQGIAVDDEVSVTALAENSQIDVRPSAKNDDCGYNVWVDGQDITREIHRPEVDTHVPVVAALPGVRKALTAQQRRIGLRGGVVMVGRDIGTVVLPEAHLKVYLDASLEKRARRRYKEQRERGETLEFGTILEAMSVRDQIDSTRQLAPLRPSDDAVILDSNHLNAEQVLERVKELITDRCV